MFVMLVAIDTKQSLGIRIATFFGIASALGVFLIGMSPVDRNYFGHMAAMALWLFPMLYMIVPFFFSASRSPYVSFWFVATSLAMILIMLIVLLSRQDGDYRLVQKMLASCGTVWLFFIIWYLGQSGFAAINDWEPSSRERIDRKSQEYYDSISKFKTSRNSKNS
jgi:beta-lactamase regulating signal transducer with metallopeptidase domain